MKKKSMLALKLRIFKILMGSLIILKNKLDN